MPKRQSGFIVLVLLLLAVAAAGCSSGADSDGAGGTASLADGETPRVVATTSIVADVVANVGGDLIDLRVLLPPGTDPHAFEPSPREVAAVADAQLVFANGLGLEQFLEPMLESAGALERVIRLSERVALLDAAGGDEYAAEDAAHSGKDPHTWTDPYKVMVWADVITAALGELDPEHAAAYQANAEAYQARLQELDTWIREQLAQIPAGDRRIVTDHSNLNYFCDRYGLELVGAIIPSYSSLAAPSARDLVELEGAIQDLGVKAVFVDYAVNSALAETVSGDTGTRLVFIYSGSLSEPGGSADSYLAYMRFNVEAIVGALR